MYNANVPTNQTLSLSSLFYSSNTEDRNSVLSRIPGGGKTNITFAASATNTPTITIGSGSRTIANLFMNNDSAGNTLGIRVSPSALSASPGNAVTWTGAGLLNKPIGDFNAGTFNNNGTSGPWFAGNGANRIRVTVNSQVIPEPKEYALVFGLFALGFVFFHRWRLHKKKRQAQQAVTS